MKIIGSSLEDTLKVICSREPKQLPFDNDKLSYFDRYEQMADKLNREFHTHVVAGSAAKDGGLLTDHGPDHIKTVINRAAALLDDPENNNVLNGYEIYLLLCAIHFHDLGNIFGRSMHEKRVSEMMAEVSSILGDSVEKDMIRKIAEAHGGKVNGDKDTISHLVAKTPINGIDVRPRMLAAILKFADELADDSYRANHALLALGAIPKSSIIYHKYASCLHSVMLRDSCTSVEINYFINVEDMKLKFPKFNLETSRYRQVYILDEVFERLHKMYIERLYCNRFMAPVVQVQSIIVNIKTIKLDEKIGEELPEINFRLEEFKIIVCGSLRLSASSTSKNIGPAGMNDRVNRPFINGVRKSENPKRGPLYGTILLANAIRRV